MRFAPNLRAETGWLPQAGRGIWMSEQTKFQRRGVKQYVTVSAKFPARGMDIARRAAYHAGTRLP